MEQDKRRLINTLIVKIGKGDEDALVALYNLTGARLLSVAKGVTADSRLAEDALQETFIKVVKYSSSFKKSDNGYGWLCRIVQNESFTIVKKYKPQDSNIDEFLNLESSNPDTSLSADNLDLKCAIAKLTKDERQLIWYKYTCDMTVRDIALKLNIPKSTVSYNIKKAEDRLKILLE